ncbi:MAG: hypothetical protein AB1782_07585 [Cyanobacteriota bacterium]
MKKSRGASLFQYVLIVFIIVALLYPVYLLFGQNIVRHLANFMGVVGDINDNTRLNLMDNESRLVVTGGISVGDLDGTPDNPVKKCVDNVCAIDFGTFVLNGMPDNINEIIETSGGSAGTVELSDLLLQLADQLDNPGTPADEGKDFRDLSNLGHLVARMQEFVEDEATRCLGASDSKACFGERYTLSYTNSNPVPLSIVNIDPELSAVIPDFLPSNDYQYSDTEYFTYITLARKQQIESPAYFNSNKAENPAMAIIDKFDKIMADPGVPDNIKYVTEQIYRNLGGISEQLLINQESVVAHTPNSYYYIDPITGGDLDFIDYDFAGSDVNNVIHLQSSAASDIDSAIICATGLDKDTGKNCYDAN